MEKQEVREAYLRSSGKMSYVMQTVPFLKHGDMARVHEMIENLISGGNIPTRDEMMLKKKIERENKILQPKKRKVEEIGEDSQKRKRTARQIALDRNQ